MSEKRDISFRDLFKGVSDESLKIDNPIKVEVPSDIYRELLDYSMERSYLDNVSQRERFPEVDFVEADKITWLQMTRLPVHPANVDRFDLFNRWQGVLSSLHAWGYRLLFLLQRKDGETNLYLGTMSKNKAFTPEDAIDQLKQATSGSMPGVELLPIDGQKAFSDIHMTLNGYQAMGAVTGLPSFADEQSKGVLQTLDSLAFGIKGSRNEDRPFSLLVISDPINDKETNDIINQMRELGSKIHADVSRTVNEGQTKGESKQKGLNQYAAANIGETLGKVLGSVLPIVGPLLGGAASIGLGNLNKTVNQNISFSVNTTYLDKFAQYAEQLTEKHIERMKQGRNLGYWNVGVYVFGQNNKDVATLGGMLRSIYAGKESYVEPIRVHLLDSKSGAMEIVKGSFGMIPLYNQDAPDMNENVQWHVFGKHYQYLSTPMNTKELALTTSLPQRDVPGIRFVKTAVRFANNPPVVSEDKKDDAICLGNLVDIGVEQKTEYNVDLNEFVRHALVCGSTGSGKSYTCKRILGEMLKKKIPVLVIEPAKDDYVRWALEMNKHLPEDMQFRIYMPGSDEFEGHKLEQLKLNPFQPAAVKGAKVDMVSRCENLVALLNASLPTSDVLPVLVDETVYELYAQRYKEDFQTGRPMEQQSRYPILSYMIPMAFEVLKNRPYEKKIKDNMMACLLTRFRYLTRGTRGQLLNAEFSTDYAELFERPTIINISNVSTTKDKALIMSILMLSLNEYRKSKYANDAEYRKRASENELLHMTLVEEAHNIMLKPERDLAGVGDPQRVVADIFSNMLSEIRSTGQGFMIVDQVPTRLIPDVIKNTNFKIVHRLTAPDDCEIMSSSLALREDQKDLIPALQQGYAIVCGDRDDAASWVHLKKSDVG